MDIPLGGVLVVLALASDPDSVLDTTLTCADGTYELVIPQGLGTKQTGTLAFRIGFSLAGYESQQLEQDIDPNAGEVLPDRELRSITPAATLAGEVTTESGGQVLVLENAQVQLYPDNKRVFTDADGRYRFPTVNQGNLTVTASAQGFLPKSVPRVLKQGDVGTASFVLEAAPVLPEDLKGDMVINAVDVQLVINGALGISADVETDVNGDDVTNAVDVQLVINAALGIAR